MKQLRVKKIFLFLKRKVQNFSYRKAVVFLVCLALSSFLWLLNSLEKRYTSRITVPVRFIEFPKDKQVSGTLPHNFDLMVDAYGYTLLSYKLRLAFSPILINVSELVDNVFDRGKKYQYTILTVNHKEEIEKQISSEMRILSIKPDSLIFNFSKIITRKIRVVPHVKIEFTNQYCLKEEPFTIPDSLLVSGPKNIMDTLQKVPTRFRNYTGLSHSVEEKIVIDPLPGLTIDAEEMMLNIPVEQNTEVTFEVPIQITNKPSDIILKTFPGKVKVSCLLGLSKFKKLDYSAFHASIDFAKITEKDTRLPVIFDSQSKIELTVNYSPKEVEYILEHEK